MADALNLEGLDFLSHPDAPPRFTTKPPEWVATYLPRYCFAVADRTDSDCRGLAQVVRELHRDGFWQRIFPDWESCCQALFQRPAVWVEQVVEGVRVLHTQGHQGEIPQEQALAAAASQAQQQPLAEHGTNQHREPEGEDLRTEGPKQWGETQSYLLRRIARDRPDILERVMAGEIKSARAAAIEAGIIKPVTTVRLTSPEAVAAKLRQHWQRKQIMELCEALLK